MDLKLTGKNVIVTGASKGIGRAVAEVLAEEGCSLHLVSRTEADLNAVRDDLNARFGAQATVHALDLSDEASVASLVAAVGDADAHRLVCTLLDRQYRYNRMHLESVVAHAGAHRAWPDELAHHYLSNEIRYEFGPRQRAGLEAICACWDGMWIPAPAGLPRVV